jgi:hypothetical protein
MVEGFPVGGGVLDMLGRMQNAKFKMQKEKSTDPSDCPNRQPF